jgi:hypothetical protein
MPDVEAKYVLVPGFFPRDGVSSSPSPSVGPSGHRAIGLLSALNG